MEANNQNIHEEAKAGYTTFRQEDFKYPCCPLHNAEASQVPKNDEGWIKHSNHILKCNRCISNEKLDSNQFQFLDEVLKEYTQELNRINVQQLQNSFVGKLSDWLKQLAALQDSIRRLMESVQGYIKIHQGDQLAQKLRSYLDVLKAKKVPEYNDFAEKLKKLKQHFSFDETKVKILDDPIMFAKKVNRRDTLLHEMVEDMQSRITKFRDGMSRIESDHNDQEIDIEDSIEDKPESIVAQSFESGTKTFKYITVEGIKSNNQSYKKVTIDHVANFPNYHFAPMTRKGTIYLIGGHGDKHLRTCWELDLKHNIMMQKQQMNNIRWSFGGVVVQGKHIQVVTGNASSSWLKSCERQDIAANTWQSIADYPVEISATTCCSFNDRWIYTIGGCVNGGSIKDIYMQEINNNTWKKADVNSAVGREITPDWFKNAIQINEKQIQLFGGHQSPIDSCLLEVDENNNGKIKVKESNRIKPTENQMYQNQQSSIVQRDKLQCSYLTGGWIYKTSCFDSHKWQVLQ